ncbi:MAG: CHAD domain-containing protein [Thermomicrobiales bacterium]|nr:CHAD domain-containing protein [Thermomicrobiales bacterium]
MAKGSERDLDPGAPFRDAMSELIATRFGTMWLAVQGAVDGSDPGSVKAVRVASRRLRAAMDVAAGCFPATWYRPLHERAKQITSELGELRDRDVMLEFLIGERDAAPSNERNGLDRLIARVSAEREAAREHVLAFLDEIERDGIAGEAVARFGPDAAASWSAPERD